MATYIYTKVVSAQFYNSAGAVVMGINDIHST